MNYPNKMNKNYKKPITYANRGMDLEELINKTNKIYLDKGIAVIYKKPTPIGVVKYDYTKSKITEAYYQSPSTLDYNGIYKGHYIEFDAKVTKQKSFPLSNIANHQIDHINKILQHDGIVFLLIMINTETYILSGNVIIDFVNNHKRKSIPYEYIKEKGIKIEYNYLKGIDYIKGIDILIKENRNYEKD